MDIGNHRYTNEQNCILLKKSVIFPIPKSFLRPWFIKSYFYSNKLKNANVTSNICVTSIFAKNTGLHRIISYIISTSYISLIESQISMCVEFTFMGNSLHTQHPIYSKLNVNVCLDFTLRVYFYGEPSPYTARHILTGVHTYNTQTFSN